MKKILTLVLALGTGLALQAQTDPLDQILYRHIVPNLVAYDSISEGTDTNNFSASVMSTASMDFHFQDNSKIDTMTLTDYGMVYMRYKGMLTATGAVLAGFMPGLTDTIEKFKYYKDQQGRDSLVHIYYFDGMELQLVLGLEYEYNMAGEVSGLHILADLGGSGTLSPFALLNIYRTGGRLDSVTQGINFGGMQSTVVRFEYFYDSNNHPRYAEVYEDTSGTGVLVYGGRMQMISNSAGEVVEIREMTGTSSANLMLEYVTRFDVKSNSSIGLRERQLTGIGLYPNPAREAIWIEGLEEKAQYRIFNLSGQELLQGQTDGYGIDITSLPAGHYLLQMEEEGKIGSFRFTRE